MTADPHAAADDTFLGFVQFLTRRKELLVIILVASLFLTYGSVYLLVDEQFEASATIIPRNDRSLGNLGGMLQNMKNLPFGLGGASVTSETDLYSTIIYSRALLEGVIDTFGLVHVYGLSTSDPSHREKAVRRLREDVQTKETTDAAFVVIVRANDPERAASITNYIVRSMNAMIVELNARRSREHRQFLEGRVQEVREQLRISEDSLRAHQERTGLLDAKVQVEGIITAYTNVETELMARELQRQILARGFEPSSPQVRELDIQIEEYRRQLKELRTTGADGGPMIALQKLPRMGIEYLRRLREVEVNALLLQFIIPLYEQARLEEKKDTPVLQVIDYAIPPVRKTWPPRSLFALIGSLSVTLIVVLVLRVRDKLHHLEDPEWRSIVDNLRRWSWSSSQKG